MYRVIYEPDYDEKVELGKAHTPQEAIEMIYFYCSRHQYTPNIFHWSKMDDPSCEVVDVSTGHDYFLIINEDGGTVKLDPVIEQTYCSAADCQKEDCSLHCRHANYEEKSKFSDLTNWCGYYWDQYAISEDPHNLYECVEDETATGQITTAAAVLSIVMILITVGLVILSICTHNPAWLLIQPVAFILSNILIVIIGMAIKNREED